MQKMEGIDVRNLKDWTKFTTQNKKRKKENQSFLYDYFFCESLNNQLRDLIRKSGTTVLYSGNSDRVLPLVGFRSL
jgi:hypothetical protein